MNYPIDISQKQIQTQRLVLRPWKESDLEDFYSYASVDGVGQMAGWLPHKDREESKMILQMFMDGKKTFALEYEGTVIGSLGVEKYKEEKFPEFADKKVRELGFVLAKDYWGKGLMAEAVDAVIRYLFEEEGLDLIMCGHYTDNAQSARVQEKCGFKHYRIEQAETRFGTRKDVWYSVLYRQDSAENKL